MGPSIVDVLPIQNDEFPQWSHDRGGPKTRKLHRKSSRMRTSTSRCDHLLWIAGDSQHHLGFRRISPEFSEVDSMCTWKYNPPHTFAVQTTLCYPGANIDVESPWFPVGKWSPQWQLVNFVRDALLRVAAEGTTIGLHRFCAAERRWKLCQTDEDRFCKTERYVEDIFI